MAEDDFEKRFRARLDAKGPTATIEPPSGAGGSFEDRFRKRLGLADGNGGNEPNAPGSPPAPDPAQAAKDTAWLDKQRADQMGIPLGLYQNLIKPVGEALPTIYSPKEYAEGVPRGYHGLDSPTGESGLLAPERVGHLAGTGQDVLAGTGAATAATVLNPFAAPVTAPLAYGTASGLSQYARTAGYRPNAGAESLVGGALNAAGGPILKGLGMGAKFVAPEFTAAVSNRLSGAGGQMLLGAGLGGTQEALRGGSAADIGEQMIGGGGAAYGAKRLGDYLGPKILENFPGSFGDKLRMQATAHEAARAGVSPEAMVRASPGGQAASPNASIPLDPIVQAALPWGPGGRVARAGYRAAKGMWNQGADERALYEKVWDTMTPGEEWTPTLKSGEPLERGPATGPNQPNQPTGELWPGPVGPPQPPTLEPQPLGPAPPPRSGIPPEPNPRGTPLLSPLGQPPQPPSSGPPFVGPAPPPRSGPPPEPNARGTPVFPPPLQSPQGPLQGGPSSSGALSPNDRGVPLPGPLGPPQGPMGPPMGPLPPPRGFEGTLRAPQFGGPYAPPNPPNPVRGPAVPVRSAALEETFPGGIQRFPRSPQASPAIEAERSAVKGALRKAAREGLEGQGPPEEGLPPVFPPNHPRTPPRTPPPTAAPIGKAPPATIAPEALSVTKPAPSAAPPAAPATPKATFYEGKGGEVVRITGEKVETLGEGGKVLTSEEVKDRVKGVGKILGTMGAKRVSDPERIAELLKRGSTPKAATPAGQTVLRSATKPVEPEFTPKTAESAPKPAEKKSETTRTLTPDHEARKAGLETPYPEEPDKTHGEKFQEVMRRVSKDGRLVEVDHQHMGLGNDATKRGKHFTMRGQIREGVTDRLTGESTKPHNPKSGAWMISLEEGFNAPEGTPANKFRRSASPFSVTEVRDAHTGEVLYRGPKVGGGPEELPPTEPKGPSEPPKTPTAPDKLKATEPPKPAEALSAEAELKAQMEAETDPDKKFELMQKWETLRKKTGLGTGGGAVGTAEPAPEAEHEKTARIRGRMDDLADERKKKEAFARGESVERPDLKLSLEHHLANVEKMGSAEAIKDIFENAITDKATEASVHMGENSQSQLRAAIRMAMGLVAHPSSSLKRVVVINKRGEVQTEINRVGTPPPYIQPEAIPVRKRAPITGGKEVPKKIIKVWEEMLEKGIPEKTFELEKGVKVMLRNDAAKPKKE